MVVRHDQNTRRVETAHFIATMREDGIVHVFIKSNTHITLEVQAEMEEAYHDITDGKTPFIFQGGEFISITKEARANAIAMEPHTPVKASALIVRNLAQKLIADYYYRFNKPKNPLKVFNDFDKGLEWLEQFKED